MLFQSVSAIGRLKALVCVSVLSASVIIALPQAANASEHIRESVIAGAWYPADPAILRGKIDGFLRQADVEPPPGKLVALIAPHAGYRYSGQVAAHAYKLLQTRKFKTVVIVAPSHYARFWGVSVYDRGGYRTPLGTVPLDMELIAELKRKDPSMRYVAEAHQKEHSLEIQLPFLQVLLPDLKLVPLVMGDQGLPTCRKLAETLAGLTRDKSVLMVASTDLSHFHSYSDAQKLDNRVVNHVRQMNVEGLASDLAGGLCEACGGGPLLVVLMASRLIGANKCEVLKALNSGDVTGDRSRVVGYMAAACCRQDAKIQAPSPAGIPRGASLLFTSEEKALLPHVAGEFGWDRITFLEHTCRKAQLAKDAWKDPQTHIFIFSAEVF